MQALKLNPLTYELKYEHTEDINLFLCSDVHFDNPKCNRDLFFSHLKRIRDKGGKALVLGDWGCFMQGKYDPRRSKHDIRPEHNKANYIDAVIDDTIEKWAPYKDVIAFVSEGNHECYDGETEILTDKGWKLFKDLDQTELVATLNMDTQAVEWQKPYNYHTSYFSGKMHSVKSRAINWMITPNHRIVYKPQGVSEYRFKESHDFDYTKGAEITVPISGISNNPEYNLVSDDELRLMAWIITDGHIRFDDGLIPRIEIYQSGDKHNIIKELLDNIGAEYSLGSRQRDIQNICGVTLKEKVKTNYTFRLKGEIRIRIWSLFGNKSRKSFPEWLHNISDRQFEVFLREYIKGDGSIHPSAESSWMAYGAKEELEKLQILCVTHGYKANLSTYRENQYRLNITKHLTYSIKRVGERFEEIEYNDFVYCVTVPNHTLFVRRRGQVFVSGNTAILKNLETDVTSRFVDKFNAIHGTNILKGGYRGWIIVRQQVSENGPFQSYKIYYNHGFGGGGEMSKGILQHSRSNMYIENADAIVMGHVHEAYCLPSMTEYFDNHPLAYKPKTRTVYNIRTACYKEEFADVPGGFHIERGRPPKPMGGVHLNLEITRNETQSHVFYPSYTIWT